MVSSTLQKKAICYTVKPNTVCHGRGKEWLAAHYKKRRSVTLWTSSSDISGYHADIHEGHGTVGAGEGRGMASVNYRTAWQGNGMGAAWERHAVCELAFILPRIKMSYTAAILVLSLLIFYAPYSVIYFALLTYTTLYAELSSSSRNVYAV